MTKRKKKSAASAAKKSADPAVKKSESSKSTKLRPMVPCYCKTCNGKLVETRTRQKHEEEEDRLQDIISLKKSKGKETSSSSIHTSMSMSDSFQIIHDDIDPQSDEEFLTPEPVIRRRRKRYDRFQKTSE